MKITKILPILLLCGSCASQRETTTSNSKILMDTLVEIKILDKNTAAIEAAFRELERIDKKFNVYNKNSEVHFINSSKSKKIPISDEMKNLLNFSIYISSITDGAFDVTIFPLVRLWNVKESEKPPSDAEIQRLISQIGYKRIALKNSSLIKERADIMLDFGGVAKGYAVEKAVKVLKEHGVKSGLINAGGDIKLFGDKSWNIGIAHPRKPNRLLGILKLKDVAIVTSGDYERYFIKDNKRYHHIMNPKTGRPAEGIMSVTVIAPDCILADALSTAIFVMGVERGLKLVELLQDVRCIIVDSNGKIFVSNGLKREKFRF